MKDYIIRATAADGQIRAFACNTRELVETARQNHQTSPVVTAALGRLLTAGSMMGIMLKGEKDILTLSIKGSGPVKGLTVTADSKGMVKGYPMEPIVNLPPSDKGKLDVGRAIGPGILNVIKDLGLKEPYSGQTILQTSEIAEDLTYYFAVSEQTPSSVGLGVLMNKDNTVRQSGGFIVQLLPFAQEQTIVKLEENLSKIQAVTTILDQGNTPEQMLELILDGMDPVFTEKNEVGFYCNCNKKRIEKALISLGRKELESMSEEDGIEVNCHFCNKHYRFEAQELGELLKKI